MNRNILLLLIIIIVSAGAYLLFMNEDTPTPAPEQMTTEMEISDYIGMTTPEAETKAQAAGTLFRVVEIDGEPQPTTRDFQEGRISATVENGIVTSYTVESMDPVVEPSPKTQEGAHDAIIGMTTTEAEVYAAENTVDFRTGTIDGEALPVTLDFRPGRITAEVENDMIIGYTVE